MLQVPIDVEDAHGIILRVHQVAEQLRRRTGIPGISVALSVRGEVLETSVGVTSLSTPFQLSGSARFQLGCITKMLTSLTALELVNSGQLNLEAALDEVLPKLCRGSDKGAIKIANLGMHTSGYEGINPGRVEHSLFYTWEKFEEFFPRARQVFAPGTIFNYEHTESVILGEVIRRVTGRPVNELLSEMLIDPLSLEVGDRAKDADELAMRVSDHSFDLKRRRYQAIRSVPYCNFWNSSLADMTMSVRSLAAIGEVLTGTRKNSGISPATIDAIRTRIVTLPAMIGGPNKEAMPRGFGFGFAEYGSHWRLLGHNGSGRGQTCGFRFDPLNNLVIVVAMNAWQPHVRDHLIEEIQTILHPVVPAVPCEQVGLLVPTPEEMEGSYAGSSTDVRIIARRKGADLLLTVIGVAGAEELQLLVGWSDAGKPFMKSDAGYLSLGFLRESGTGVPCLMLGLNTFRRVDD